MVLWKSTPHDLRTFGTGNYRQIDDYQYGGGAGMVLMIEPLARLIRSLQQDTKYDQCNLSHTPTAKHSIRKL